MIDYLTGRRSLIAKIPAFELGGPRFDPMGFFRGPDGCRGLSNPSIPPGSENRIGGWSPVSAPPKAIECHSLHYSRGDCPRKGNVLSMITCPAVRRHSSVFPWSGRMRQSWTELKRKKMTRFQFPQSTKPTLPPLHKGLKSWSYY